MAAAPALQLDAAEMSRGRSTNSNGLELDVGSRTGQIVPASRGDHAQRRPARELARPRGALGKARQRLAQRARAHGARWSDRWQCSDIEIEGDAAAQQALRFSVYHLNSAAVRPTAYLHRHRATGDSYLGRVLGHRYLSCALHVATWPEAARALLMYATTRCPAPAPKPHGRSWRGAMSA
jgi:trehalose/maltose hydrolase-like predicted phosphorylase